MSRSPNIKFAQKLRCQSTTDTEKTLWLYLRRRAMNGLKFRRQHPIGPYIVDFVCLERKVVIELDGSQHTEQEQKEQARDRWLEKEGYRVLRFFNNEFLEQQEEALEKIVEECMNRHPLPA